MVIENPVADGDMDGGVAIPQKAAPAGSGGHEGPRDHRQKEHVAEGGGEPGFDCTRARGDQRHGFESGGSHGGVEAEVSSYFYRPRSGGSLAFVGARTPLS